MKGYDVCVFPREGEPVLVCLEASADDAERTAWTSDVASLRRLRPVGPAPAARARARRRERVRRRVRDRRARALARNAGLGPHGRRADDVHRRVVHARSATHRMRHRSSPRLVRVKTEQEIERMRLANDIAAAAMEHCKLVIEPGMTEAQIAAEWVGFVHGEGTGWEGKVDLALGFSLVWSGAGDPDIHRDDVTPRRRGRADALRDLGLCRRLLVRPHEEPRRRRADSRVP